MKYLNNPLIVGALILAAPLGRAIDINDTNTVFYVMDAEDRGCRHQADNAMSACPTCNTKGVPDWWVSEPYINLWVSDKPATYTTSLGQEMAFQITYDQRDMRPTNTYYPVTGWNHNWNSYIRVTGYYDLPGYPSVLSFKHWAATVGIPNGGETYYAYNQRLHPSDGTQLLPLGGSDDGVAPHWLYNPNVRDGNLGADYGFRRVFPDGSQDIYQQLVAWDQNDSPLKTLILALNERIDPFGNITHLYYTNDVAMILLKYVVDPDGRTTTFTYNAQDLLTRVDMPYGLQVNMSYVNGKMTGISDAMQMPSSFAYDGITGFMTNMVTPYGTNIFEHTDLGNIAVDGNNVGNAGGTNRVSRACRVTSPDGSHELYTYRFDSSQVGITNSYIAQAPSGTPLNTLDTGGTAYQQSMSYLRNSFHWNAKQYSLLYTTNIPSLTAQDYKISTMSHWLVRTGTTNYLSSTISLRCDPSLDGTNIGQVTWFDYPGRTGPTLWSEGTDAQQTAVIAQVLPDATAKYTWAQYEPYGKVTNSTSTYTTAGGGIGTRSYVAVYTNVAFSMQDRDTAFYPNYPLIYWTNSMLIAVKGLEAETLLTVSGLTNATLADVFSTFTNTYTLPVYRTQLLTDVSNNVTIVSYNTRHQVAGIHYPTGLNRTNFFDGNGFLSKSIDLETARTNGFGFTNGLLSRYTNELGLVTTYAWDNLQRLVSITYPDSTSVTNLYTYLDLTDQKDRMNHWSHATYDSMRQMHTCTDNRGNQATLNYCTCGSLDSIVDPLNNCTTFWRDNLGRITYVTYPAQAFSQYNYDSVGRVLSVTNSAGLGLTNTYNNQGLVVKTAGAYGPIYQARYNIHDLADYTIDGSGIATTNTYDLLGRVTSTRNANGTNYFLYSGKLLGATVDPLNRTNWYGYDAAGRNTCITNANLEIRTIIYDAAGHVISLTDGRNLPTTWAYNAYGRNIAETNASGVVIRTNGYNANGQLVALWTKGKGLTTYSPDANGNITNISYPSSGHFGYAYDPLNRIQAMTDGTNSTTFGYQSLGAFAGGLLTEDGPWNSDTVTLAYTNGVLGGFTLAQPSGSWGQTNVYDKQLRLQSLTSPAGSFTFGYNSAGRQIGTITLPAGTIAQTFDAVGNLTNTTLKDPLNNIVDPMSYNYNAAGVITNLIRGTEGSKVFYTYDKIDQIATALGYEASGTARYNETFGYSYDKAGNWMSRTNGALSQQTRVNGLNDILSVDRNAAMTVAGSLDAPIRSLYVQITNYSQQQQSGPISLGNGPLQPLPPPPPGASNGIPAALYQDLTFATTSGVGLVDGTNYFQYNIMSLAGYYSAVMVTQALPVTVSFTYDDNRNLLSDGARNFSYDDANRLIEVYATNNWRSTYTYDGLSRRRIRKDYTWQAGWSLSDETHYIYLGNSVIQERNSLNQTKVSYTRGLGLLARTDSTNGSLYYHTDGNNNVTALVNGQGTLVARYTYDPFGNLIGKHGSLADVNLYRFASQEVHPLSGLYAYTYRFYDPNLQRWINKDPIGFLGGRNPFAFVGNNPLNNIDPLGLSWRDELALVGKGIYDLMMGDSVGRPNPDMKGALDAQMGVVDIDRNDNVLRDSMGGVAVAAGVTVKEAAQLYVGGKAAEAAGELLGSALPKVGQIAKCLRGGAKAAETTATQLEFNFAKEFGQNSGLVIGRGADLSAPGALGAGEYKLGWFSVQGTSGMDAEWAVNQAKLQNVMNLNLPIRDASSLLDTGGFYLNNERGLLQSSGWNYQSGFWVPPTH